MSKSDAIVPIGVIIGAHGIRGELRVKPYNPSSELLLGLRSAILRKQGEPAGKEIALRSVRRHGEGFLVVIDASTDRDVAQSMRGDELCVTRAQLPAPEPGEYYLLDLVGLEARLADGTVLGRVAEAIEYPASTVLRVEIEGGAIEVPMHERYLLEVRLDDQLVIVDHVDELDVQPSGPRGPAHKAIKTPPSEQ